MLFQRNALRVQLAVLTCGFLSAASLGGADKPVRANGGGGFPVTDSVTSSFGAVDELVPPGKKPITFMVYFRGKKGWPDRGWKVHQEFNADPFVSEFVSDLITLRVAVARTSRKLTVFGRQIDLAKTNVILVDHVDQPGSEVVTELDHVDLLMPEDANPSTWVLQQYDSIQHRVLPPSP